MKCSGKTGKAELAGSVVEKTTISRPDNLQAYANIGTTTNCFSSEDSFDSGTIRSCDYRIVLLADKTSVTTLNALKSSFYSKL